LSKRNATSLNDKQLLFVKHYLMTFNAKQSAIAAGYSERTAESQGSRLLSNVKVEKYIKEEMGRLRSRMSDDANRIYAALWTEVNEMTDLINAHYAAKKTLKSLLRDKHAMLYGVNADDESQVFDNGEAHFLRIDPLTLAELRQSLREINFKMQHAQMDQMGDKDFLRTQELRAKLLHDLFDRAGYKPTDKIDLKHNVSGGLDLRYMSDEELAKEAAKLG